MQVVCHRCNKQHQVNDQMAGKRAKCGCGEVMTIPAAPLTTAAAPSQPTADWLDEPLATSTTSHAAGQPVDSTGTVVFQCEYGFIRRSMWLLLGVNVLIALVLIPAGFLWNDGWALNNVELPPWLAMVLFEFVALGQLALFGYTLAGYLRNRDQPQRVAITTAGVILPKGKLSNDELFIPWAQVKVKHRPGPADQLEFKRGALNANRLVSIQFRTNDDFETFARHLRERGKL